MIHRAFADESFPFSRHGRSLCAWLALALALGAPACSDGGKPDEHAHAEGDAHDRDAAEPAGGEHGAAEHADDVTLTPEALAANGVRIELAEARLLRPTFRVPAQIAFNRDGMAHVGSPVKGRVSELFVKLGDEVLKGAPLLSIESSELGEAQSDLLQKRSAARTTRPAVELAKNAYERAKGLYEQTQGLPLTEVQKREGEFRAAEAAREAADTAEQAAENKLHLLGMSQAEVDHLTTTGEIDPRFAVRAPIAGQVIEREVTLGELVGPDRDTLLVLADISKLWILADVPEAKLHTTAVGARALVLLGAEQDPKQSHWCEGRVTFISPALDPGTRSVRVRIEALDRHPELRPGVFAQAEITAHVEGSEPAKPVLAVPDAAVQTVEGETAVFVPVPGEPGTFAKRVVRVGASVGGMLPVFAGLAWGEAYVAEGSFILKAELGKAGAEHRH
ncbi:MAG: efflux RND transporter periplasmic adaptor subunit [Planctomycetes bacterium]|nr:efflux RND transporter periplasmic adaptor subunit [Planctomycetota bacterium]